MRPKTKLNKQSFSINSAGASTGQEGNDGETPYTEKLLDEPNTTNNVDIVPSDEAQRAEKNLYKSFVLDHEKGIKFFGCPLPSCLTKHPAVLFIFLTVSVTCTILMFNFSQELVLHVPGFEYEEFITVVETTVYIVFGFFELLTESNVSLCSPKAPRLNLVILSMLLVYGLLCTNWSLAYLSYPTRVIFKGSKPVPTMIIEYFYVGKVFKWSQSVSVVALTIGVTLFCYGEATTAPTFDPIGMLFITIGTSCDVLFSNYAKKKIFSYGSTHVEAMFWSSVYGFFFVIITLLILDWQHLMNAATFVYDHASTCLVYLIMAATGGYMSKVLLLLMVKVFSATWTECVKGSTRVFYIAGSFLFVASDEKTFGPFHAAGTFFLILSTVILVVGRDKTKK